MPTPVPAGAAPVAAVPARCWLLKAQSLTLPKPAIWISYVGVIGQGVNHGVFVR
jgi:hypothetical protein